MRYHYYDLGYEQDDRQGVLRMRGTSANVILLDRFNFHCYRTGQPFFYRGGHYRRSPVRFQIPQGEHWYLVIDHGGYRGNVQTELQVLSPAEPEHETMPMGAVA